MREEFTFTDPYEQELHAYLWTSEQPTTKGVVMIVHGAGEHCQRYDHFAQYLNQKGFHVIGNDLRGHGRTADTDATSVYFGSGIGFHKVYEGVKMLRDIVGERFGDLPVILFAHSMGSFIGRYALLYDQNRYDMAIFSGTGLVGPTRLAIARLIAKLLIAVKGDHHVSPWFNDRIMGQHIRDMRKKGIINRREEWISQDPAVQREVKEDPLCNKPFTLGAQQDIIRFLPEIQDKQRIKATASATAIYFLSGDLDGMGNYGADIKKLYDIYRECGYSNVKYTVLNNTRHEILNDVERARHFEIISEWIERNL